MPYAFDRCVKKGGRVRTIKKGGKKYQYLCFKGGKSYAGHIKKRKS